MTIYIGGNFFYHKINGQTLKWLKVPEDSSDFDEFCSELIVMTQTFILATLRFFLVFFSRLGTGAGGWRVDGENSNST